MTDTDAGKRLSDAELKIISDFNKQGLHDFDYKHYESPKHVAALLSHIAALTPNRGSVSEDRACYRHVKRGSVYAVIGEGELQCAKALFDGTEITIYQGDDGKLWARPTTEFEDGRFEKIAAIRQAVSECSGGGAEEMRQFEYRWREVARCVKNDHIMPALNEFGADGWEVFNVEPTLSKKGDDTYGVWMRRALPLPLPPSPVAQKPVCSTYHSRAIGVACSNCGHLKEEHQGGEGK